MTNELTTAEVAILQHLVRSWEFFLTLENVPRADMQAFRYALHTCRSIIFERNVDRLRNQYELKEPAK